MKQVHPFTALPDGWQIRPMKRVLSEPLKYGANETGEEGSRDWPRYIRITDFGSDGRLRDETYASLPPEVAASYLLESGDLLFARSGATVGKCYYYDGSDGPACFAGYLLKATAKKNKLAGRYLYHFTASPQYSDWRDSAFVQATIENIGARRYNTLPVPLPPFPEQMLIAKYLDACCEAIDNALATKQQQLGTLDALRKSIIQRVVTQGLNAQVRMKVVPMDGVGLVPVHWRVKQLRYCCQISYGITLQLEAGKTTGVPILTVQNLDVHGDWKFDQEFCIDEELVSEDDILRHGDLLFNWRNGSSKHVGKTAFFNLDGRYTHVSFLLRMRCGKDLSPFYLKSYLGALRMAGFFEGAKDKVNKTFNSTELNRLSVLVPPIKEQEAIVEFVQAKWDEIEKVLQVIESQIETLTAYRKSLIHECVTGQRRITEADVTHAQAHV